MNNKQFVVRNTDDQETVFEYLCQLYLICSCIGLLILFFVVKVALRVK